MKAIFIRSVLQIVRRPIYWLAFFILPLFCFLFLTNLMENGLPIKVPAAMVDKDGSALSRSVTQQLGGMEMVDLVANCNSFTEARHKMQEGEIFGYFFIPEDFQQDLFAGRKPVITFYTNMTYFVPGSLLFKTFKTTALYTKAGIALNVMESVIGANEEEVTPLMLPINIDARAIHNPGMNYAIYLCNSFNPCVLQLMIFLVTCFSLGQEKKYGTSVKLLRMANGSIIKALAAKLLPQTIIWLVIAIFMESWLFKINGYPVYGSWFWLTVSEVMYVFACQGLAVFFFGILPSLRLSLSISALLGILSFSIAAFSYPVESMYTSIGIFSWILPIRYNFLIYIDQALDGVHVYYSRIWFVAYIIFMLLPFTIMWRIKKEMAKPVYAP
ncbi:MAG: ABC transporter permease [Muribaculaceae bacterium]|nr:ABC transporter permease [Muribaculaceae bacterium]